MKKIILASASAQRRKLLKQLNFQFKVVHPKIREIRRVKSLSCAQLVKHNAALKAKDVAARFKDGIVVAADTAVFSKGRIIGKPKNKRDALRILRHLSRNPHLVFTGIAVYDIARRKFFCGYEKTKVFMNQMSDKEIINYINRVHTLDKAGSFDIQKWGGLFIRRIEGCFYNVVGLPLARLNSLLKKAGVIIFSLSFLLTLSGCSEYNLATGKQEVILYSSDREVRIGRNVSRSVEEQFEISEDLMLRDRVYEIGQKVAAVCDRKDINYYFEVIKEPKEEDLVNAFSLPGGYIYVFEELAEVASDDELACVLGHEVGHIAARHGIKRLQAALGYTLLRLATLQTDAAQLGAGPDIAFNEILLAYSRQDEFLADKLGIDYAKEAGYDPAAMISFLNKIKEIEKDRPAQKLPTYSRSHPYIADRIRKINQSLYGQIEFIDYYNKGLEY